MRRVLDWLKSALHKRSEVLTHVIDLDEDDAHRQVVADDMKRKDRSIDRRITALEEFAEQLKQRPVK